MRFRLTTDQAFRPFLADAGSTTTNRKETNMSTERVDSAPYRLKAGAPVDMWIDPADVESGALDQIRNVAALSWTHKIAVMPDVHYGYGAPIGSVIAMKGAVSPSAVGVDLGCGMAAVRTNLTALDLPDDLHRLRLDIERAIPVGFNRHKRPVDEAITSPVWDSFSTVTEKVQGVKAKAVAQCGTLGGGNHFIEVCLNDSDEVWLMLHSGSRNIGKTIADIYIAQAKGMDHNVGLPDKNLAVLLEGSAAMADYVRDANWAQTYAAENRRVMLSLLKTILRSHFPHVQFDRDISCHHNFIDIDTFGGERFVITRKGAIRVRKGELAIIPGSMGTRSYIVKGKGNAAAFDSASHGAGRRMSRSKAKRQYNADDLAEQTRGVECRKSGVVDEIPAAYKDIERVIDAQQDLIEPVEVLKQVLCVKG